MLSSLTPDNPKICIITETYYPVVGGGETQARGLAEALVAKGFRVMVLTRRSDASLPKVEIVNNVTIYRLPPAGKQHLKKWGLLFTSVPALFRLRGRYDLVFVSGFRVLGFAGVIASEILGKTCILKADNLGEMSGEFFRAGLAKWGLQPTSVFVRPFVKIRDCTLKRAHAFVAISSPVKNELAMCGVAERFIHTIPNGVDTNRFRPTSMAQKQTVRDKLGLPRTAEIVTFTGRLVSYKGLPTLLKAWKRIQRDHSGVVLLLVGGGGVDIHNCEAQLREFTRENRMENSVRFVGDVGNVHEYLQASDLFVFPTEREAFGISLVEAMACGLPVISTSAGGLSDIVRDGRNGLVVEPQNCQQLCRAIDKLLTDPYMASQLGRAARDDAEKHYSAEHVTAEYARFFKTAHSRFGRAHPTEIWSEFRQ